MMLPPDEFDNADFKPYAVPRGTCPRCGSNDIRHLIIGLPAGPEPVNSTPGVGRLGGLRSPRTRPRVQPLRVSMDRESTGVRRPAAAAAAAGIPGATQAAHPPMTVANPPRAPIRHTF